MSANENLKDNTFNFKVDLAMDNLFNEVQKQTGFTSKTMVFEFMIMTTADAISRGNPQEQLFHYMKRQLGELK